jgi:hypothetical protein
MAISKWQRLCRNGGNHRDPQPLRCICKPRLETILLAMGREAIGGQAVGTPGRKYLFKKVLHVGSELSAVGGLTRMISRWIDADADRTSSLVLTQRRGKIPP